MPKKEPEVKPEDFDPDAIVFDGLTNKQRMFCHEYLIDMNASQSAIRAGYSENSAKEIGYENLTKPHIKSKVAELLAERAKRAEITADRVINELAKLAFGDVRNIFTPTGELIRPDKLSDDAAACISQIEVVTRSTGQENEEVEYVNKYRLADKRAALESLAKNLKILPDITEISGPGGSPIQHEAMTTDQYKQAREEAIKKDDC